MRNVKYTEYDLVTGKILRVVSSSTKKLPKVRDGVGRIMTESSPQDQIVVNGEIVGKHKFNVTTTRTGNDIELGNVPEGTIINAEDEQFIMDSSNILELTLDQPVTVTIMLMHDLYETKVLNIES